MSRPSTVRKPTATELRRIHHWLEKPLLPWQRRRAEVLLLHAAVLPATSIAPLLQVHPNTVYTDLRDFDDGRVLWPRATSPLLIVDDVQEVGSLQGRLAVLLGQEGSRPSPDQLARSLEQASLDRQFLSNLGRRRSIWVIGALDGGDAPAESAAIPDVGPGDRVGATDGGDVSAESPGQLSQSGLERAEKWMRTIQELLACGDDQIRLVVLTRTNSEVAKPKVQRRLPGYLPTEREREMLWRDLR